ncbi:hypothetical protein BLGI_2585 [Brevibacillus laterosporus GI-9]|nr:hypothetical protein BLGI_2585 [Brevibacillus laterosporus GI-9]
MTCKSERKPLQCVEDALFTYGESVWAFSVKNDCHHVPIDLQQDYDILHSNWVTQT